MFRKIMGRTADGAGAAMARKMGGDPTRLNADEQRQLDAITANMPAMNDVDALLNHVQQHGNSEIGAQMALLNKAGAFERGTAAADARDDAYRALWASDVPQPTEAQLDVLENLPTDALRSFVSQNCRTGLVFEPQIRPATAQDLTFAGGLPIVDSGLNWPTRIDHTGAQVPCHFLGQINCAELPDFDLRHLFPADGALVFFLSLNHSTYSAPLVQHCSLLKPQQVPPPEGLPRADSYFDETRSGAITTGWPHEQGHAVPRHSIFPKFALTARLACQAPRHSWFAEQEVDIPAADLAAFKGDQIAYLQDCFDAVNTAQGQKPRQSREQVLTDRGFDGFPHIWGSVARLLETFELQLNQTAAFYDRRMAANSDAAGPEEHSGMSKLWIKDTAAAQAAEVSRTQTLLDQLRATGALLAGWIERAQGMGRATPVSDKDRAAFWTFWDSMLANTEHFPLESPWSPDTPLNAAYKVKELVMREATFGAIASFATDPDTIRPDLQDILRGYLASLHGRTRYEHVQSLGHVDATDSESPFLEVLLMQFPSSDLFDWMLGDAGSAQFWITQNDLQTARYDKATLHLN